jgi:hypothetical protein
MAEKDKWDREFAVGDKLRVKLHDASPISISVRSS